ncbi:MAG TPA: 3-phosphoshikimate 1-carboxyvinyltransferase [Acidimicrobiia bacterium]|nr:3-phosphoshikimate 1-carboxyvinyltransferase [Acidimicrobiia bacterium]
MTEQAHAIETMSKPLDGVVEVPGSKSETIRALAAAAMAPGRSHLYGPLRAEDPEAMCGALRNMGIAIDTDTEPWSIDGRGGHLEGGGNVDAHESGLSARILIAMAASASGATHIGGTGRLPERPMGGILELVRSQGVEVEGERIPLSVVGRGHLWGGHWSVDCSESSQFATAALLVAPLTQQPTTIEPRGLSSSAGYLEGTVSIMERFGARPYRTVTGFEIANDGYRSADVVIEPDASAAVYPMAIAAVSGGRVEIEGLGASSWQPDREIASALGEMGCRVEWHETRVSVDARGIELAGIDTDMSHAPDGALALAVTCLFASGPSVIRGLGSLRHKESDRLQSISQEMRRLGGAVDVVDDTLRIEPSPLHGGVVDPHGDHRIAMSMAIIGTRVKGVAISSPRVVAKTWPGFWRFLDDVSA